MVRFAAQKRARAPALQYYVRSSADADFLGKARALTSIRAIERRHPEHQFPFGAVRLKRSCPGHPSSAKAFHRHPGFHARENSARRGWATRIVLRPRDRSL